MDAELIKLEVDDYVGIVTINNPPVNAHSQQVLEEIDRKSVV